MATTSTISDMRYTHLLIEAGSLLARLYRLGASFEDCERAKHLFDNPTPQTIGAIIHDLQAQVGDLERSNAMDGIDPEWLEDKWEGLEELPL